MIALLKVMRPFNLLILAISLVVIHNGLIVPQIHRLGLSEVWKPINFYLFSSICLFLAAGGNTINDYFDFEADKLKSNKPFLRHTHHYLNLYYILFTIGGICTFLLLKPLNILMWGTLYFVFSLTLFLYSAKLKSSILLGNILVASMTAIPFILLMALEINSISAENLSLISMGFDVILFSVFAFLINLIREIAKDLEDAKIDSQFDIATFANTYSISTIRKLLLILSGVLILSLGFWISKSIWMNTIFFLILSGVFLMIPTLVLIYRIFKLESTTDFQKLSIICKTNMVLAIVFLTFFI